MFNLKTVVLIVDDMRTMRMKVSKCCREIGFTTIVEAADGQEAWEKLNESSSKIGLVLSDWNMPKLSGLDLLKRVRADAALANIPFVMITAEAEQSQIAEAITAKANSYILKPFDTEALKTKLEEVHKSTGD